MSKSLSNGTLGLRFMQNALRRQQLQEVELKRAEIKDEGKWEVGQNVKDAWGIGKQTSGSVVHESSYLPFLFFSESPEHEATTSSIPKPLGRRMFNKRGLDVSQGHSQSQPQEDVDIDRDAPDGEGEPDTESMKDPKGETLVVESKGRKTRIHANPKPISSHSLGNRSLRGFDDFDQLNKAGSKSARDAIFSMNGVGIDLRSVKKLAEGRADKDIEQKPNLRPQSASSLGFLKPAGVSEPAVQNSATISKPKLPKLPVSDVIDGARKKRVRDLNEPLEEEKKKKKRKSSKLRTNTADAE